MLFAPKIDKVDEKILTTKVFDKTFKNPIGLAAGFDKDAEVIINSNFYIQKTNFLVELFSENNQ